MVHAGSIVQDDTVLTRIVSGGQTGVDRAALDVALELGLPCGGWCPRGRRAEDGPLDPRYPLRETPTKSYAERTEWNVRDSDGTLVLTVGPARGGTALTVELAQHLGKPVLVVDLDGGEAASPALVVDWIRGYDIAVLNVAGPRASETSGIQARAMELLRDALRLLVSRRI